MGRHKKNPDGDKITRYEIVPNDTVGRQLPDSEERYLMKFDLPMNSDIRPDVKGKSVELSDRKGKIILKLEFREPVAILYYTGTAYELKKRD